MAITATYRYPVTGTTPPAASLVRNKSKVIVDVAFSAAADTGTNVVHNFGIPTNTDGSTGNPMVFVTMNSAGVGADVDAIIGYVDGNTISCTKSQTYTTSSTASFRLTIWPRFLN